MPEGATAARATPRPRVAVFAPSPLVTVTVEPGDGVPDVHFHAGGQGVWVARLAGALGAEVRLCTVLGGESGRLLSVLLATTGVEVLAARGNRANGSYVHDRRTGQRTVVAEVPAPRLHRHEIDDLYGIALTRGMDCGVMCLTGPQHAQVLEPDVYRRLATDLRSRGVIVVADLSDPVLSGALEGGVDVLKLSVEELVSGGWAADDAPSALVAALSMLHERGAETVIASRAAAPALVLREGHLLELGGLTVAAADPIGAGDAMVAALAVALAEDRPLEDALRFGAAAGALNATRHGLGSGERSQIELLARAVRLVEPETAR
jgi:1-phosphofructokinase